jgi:hypothetical protein
LTEDVASQVQNDTGRPRTLYDAVHEWWNNLHSLRGPARYFGIMHPVRIDSHGDVIYKLVPKTSLMPAYNQNASKHDPKCHLMS